jgi:hypothetical protein
MPNRMELDYTQDGDRQQYRKGIMRNIRETKRAEAEERNQHTVPDKRRAFWRERGFSRQSQAAATIKGVVILTNEQAKIHKQRSQDWPMINEDPATRPLSAV